MAALLAEVFVPFGERHDPAKRAALVLMAEIVVNLRCVGAFVRALSEQR